MSKSRLEKFLYALYSLDPSDLPKPLSRIEELYKCLVTGEEAPTFKPLSRVEKYLMAILWGYDVDSLPNPLSRVEVLLHKLATGDDNLDDVKSFLSEHEELLAEIIRNGGVGENIDIEYVLYTLSTGYSTLYNTAEKPVKSAILKGKTLVNLSVNSGYKTVTFTSTQTYIPDFQYNVEMYKPNTKYLVITEFNHDYKYSFGVNIPHTKAIFGESTLIQNGVGKVYKHILTTKSDFTGCDTALRTVVYKNTEETDFSLTYRMMIIEYQDGMENWDIPYFVGMGSVRMPVLTTSNEDGTKSNILTVNEEVELCGIGDIKDELDLLTGELVQKTEKIIFDGSEAWEVISSLEKDNTIFAQCYKYTRNNTNAISNVLDYRSSLDALDKRGFRFNHFFQIRLNKNEISNITNNAVKEWVSKNNINVVRVEEQTVKTVDLSVVDQDGNDTELSTFNDITHVTLSSEGLIPEVELEVATKNEEVINTMSLEMDDISKTQNDLQETLDTQSENVDSTMIATTEIYEGLL